MFAIALPYGLKLTDMNVIPNATVSGFSSGSSVLATPQGASNVIATVTAATLSRAIVGYSGTDCIIVKLLWNRVGGVIFNRVNVCIELNITRNGFIDVASTFGY